MGEEDLRRLCVYYEKDTQKIIDFFPADFSAEAKGNLLSVWNQTIPRQILITLSDMEQTTMQDLKKKIGHSNSTLHENVKKLEDLGLIRTGIIYKGNKIRVLRSQILFITKNPKFKRGFRKLFQGIWVNSSVSKQVIDFLQKHPDKYMSVEEIASALKLPVDEIELELSNWDSSVTRAFGDVFKEKPFEKKVLYKGKK
jgi:DNA-binding transcriptional regulator GbsR (MarR family)